MLSAHLIKHNTVKLIENIDTDNIKISYDKVGITGFPFAWKIIFSSMKITSIEQDGLDEILLDKVSIKYYLYKINILLGSKIYFSDSKNPEPQKDHKIFSQTDHKIYINYNIPVLQIKNDNIFKDIKSLEFHISPIKYWIGEQLTMEIAQGNLSINKSILQNKEMFKVQASSEAVVSQNQNLNFLLDTHYIVSLNDIIGLENAETKYDYRIIVNKLLVKYDESILNFSGALNLKKDIPPEGKLKIVAKNYHSLIDELLPDNFVISKAEIKNFIDINSEYENNNELLYFNIIFSPQGIETGSKKTMISI